MLLDSEAFYYRNFALGVEFVIRRVLRTRLREVKTALQPDGTSQAHSGVEQSRLDLASDLSKSKLFGVFHTTLQ